MSLLGEPLVDDPWRAALYWQGNYTSPLVCRSPFISPGPGARQTLLVVAHSPQVVRDVACSPWLGFVGLQKVALVFQ